MKVIIFGDIEGRYDAFSARLNKINLSKGPFDICFIVGKFLDEKSSEDLNISLPIPCFAFGNQNIDKCQNITFLKNADIQEYKGLSFCYLSESSSHEQVDSLTNICSQSNFHGIDIFLSSDWPFGWESLHSGDEMKITGSRVVSKIVSNLCPKYHFAGFHDKYIQSSPYNNKHKNILHSTRFIALAKFGGISKERSMYAFSIVPLSEHSMESEVAKLPCPYLSQKRKIEEIDETQSKQQKLETKESLRFSRDMPEIPTFSRWSVIPPATYVCHRCNQPGHYIKDCPSANLPPGYVCHICNQSGHHIKDCPSKSNSGPKRTECWFCLATPECETHMIVSIGNEVYLALSKGGIVEDHLLILPIVHTQSYVDLSEKTKNEIELYKLALIKCYASQNMNIVFYERNIPLRGAMHMHLQAVIIPEDVSISSEDILHQIAAENQIKFTPLNNIKSLSDVVENNPYMLFQLPDNSIFIHIVDTNFIPKYIHFGRKIIAELLGVPEKIDWHKCQQSKEEETKITERIQKLFETFDPHK